MTKTRRCWLTAGIIASVVTLSACGQPAANLSRRPRPPRTTTTVHTTTTVKSTTTTTSTTTVPATTTTTVPSSTLNNDKPFVASSPWNTPTPAGTQWFNPPSVLSSTDWWVNGSWIPYFATASDPIWTFQMPNFVDLSRNVNRPAQNFTLRAPSNIAPSADSDAQLAVVQPDGSYIEVWRANVNATTHVVTSTGPGWGTGNAITGQGVGGLVSQGGNNAGTRAANFSFAFGGRISLDEINGSTPIDHALVVCMPSSLMLNAPTIYVAPATAGDSFGSGTLKMGTRIGIPAGVAMPAGLTPLAQKIFTATQKYGMFVGDFCGGGVPVLQSDAASSFWDSSLHLISPLLRIADYQP